MTTAAEEVFDGVRAFAAATPLGGQNDAILQRLDSDKPAVLAAIDARIGSLVRVAEPPAPVKTPRSPRAKPGAAEPRPSLAERTREARASMPRIPVLDAIPGKLGDWRASDTTPPTYAVIVRRDGDILEYALAPFTASMDRAGYLASVRAIDPDLGGIPGPSAWIGPKGELIHTIAGDLLDHASAALGRAHVHYLRGRTPALVDAVTAPTPPPAAPTAPSTPSPTSDRDALCAAAAGPGWHLAEDPSHGTISQWNRDDESDRVYLFRKPGGAGWHAAHGLDGGSVLRDELKRETWSTCEGAVRAIGTYMLAHGGVVVDHQPPVVNHHTEADFRTDARTRALDDAAVKLLLAMNDGMRAGTGPVFAKEAMRILAVTDKPLSIGWDEGPAVIALLASRGLVYPTIEGITTHPRYWSAEHAWAPIGELWKGRLLARHTPTGDTRTWAERVAAATPGDWVITEDDPVIRAWPGKRTVFARWRRQDGADHVFLFRTTDGTAWTVGTDAEGTTPASIHGVTTHTTPHAALAEAWNYMRGNPSRTSRAIFSLDPDVAAGQMSRLIDNIAAAQLRPPPAPDFASIRAIFRAPDTLTLWGIPYDMKEGQEPGDIWRGVRDAEALRRQTLPSRQDEIPVADISDWIYLGEPGWWGTDTTHRDAAMAFVEAHPEAKTLNPYEWFPVPRLSTPTDKPGDNPAPSAAAPIRPPYTGSLEEVAGLLRKVTKLIQQREGGRDLKGAIRTRLLPDVTREEASRILMRLRALSEKELGKHTGETLADLELEAVLALRVAEDA